MYRPAPRPADDLSSTADLLFLGFVARALRRSEQRRRVTRKVPAILGFDGSDASASVSHLLRRPDHPPLLAERGSQQRFGENREVNGDAEVHDQQAVFVVGREVAKDQSVVCENRAVDGTGVRRSLADYPRDRWVFP